MAKFDKGDIVIFADPDIIYIGKIIITPELSEDECYTILRVEFDKLGNAKESIETDIDEDDLTEINYYHPFEAIIDIKFLQQIRHLEEA